MNNRNRQELCNNCRVKPCGNLRNILSRLKANKSLKWIDFMPATCKNFRKNGYLK